MQKICLDLLAEYEELQVVLSTLTEQQWQQTSPFKNWTIYDHVEHLHFFDLQGLSALQQPQAFVLYVEQFKQAEEQDGKPPCTKEELMECLAILSDWLDKSTP